MNSIKHPSLSDLEQVFQFMLACDIDEFGEPDSSREDLEEQWGEINLQEDAWIALDDQGRMIGYACITCHDTRYQLDLFIHSKLTPKVLEDDLVANCLQRVKDLMIETHTGESTIICYATGVNQRLQQVYERHGFAIHTHHYRMQIDFNEPVSAPDWPVNFTLSAYKDSDEAELFQLIQAAFDWEGITKLSIESWRGSIFRGGRFDPEFFVLVRDGDRLVAAALSYAEDIGGWIRQLAVAKEYQGRGLGGRLLRHMFYVFYHEGLPSVALGVASANSNAFQFYERNGMKKTRDFIEYRKLM